MKKIMKRKKDPEQTEQKRVCIFRHIVLGSCALFTVLMLLLFIGLPDKPFSEMENRSLAGVPDPDAADLLSGRFMKNAESWTADQFPGRTGSEYGRRQPGSADRTRSAECISVTTGISWKRRYSLRKSLYPGLCRTLRLSAQNIRI